MQKSTETPQSERRPDPKELTAEYHRAHKQVMLWGAILLFWELVGVDLDEAKKAEGNVGVLAKSIKNPQAVPWILVILLGYFLFKVSLEWYQCNRPRRMTRVAKTDFLTAWVVSLLAFVLYVGQTLTHMQLAERLQNSQSLRRLLFNTTMGFFLWMGFVAFRKMIKDRNWIAIGMATPGYLLFSVYSIFALVFEFRLALPIPIVILLCLLIQWKGRQILNRLKSVRLLHRLDA
jgi:CDP-diglyceride synthetase